MHYSLPLDEMTVEEKLRVLESIWEDLLHNAEDIPSPSWHAIVLQECEKNREEGTDKATDWEEAKKQIRESLQ